MCKRLLLILALGLLLAQVTVVAASVLCACCPCSVADDDCPKRCESCLSAAMTRMVVPTEMGVRTLSPVGAVLPSLVLPRRAADPQEIFHVPRPTLS